MKNIVFITGMSIFVNYTIAQSFHYSSNTISSHAIYLRSMDVKTADFNGDGYNDIALAIEWAPNALLWGSKEGIYQDNHTLKLSANRYDSEDIAIADFNNDGWPDIIFAAEDDQNHEFYLNQGHGKMLEIKQAFPPFIANAVQAFDFNNDGYTDVIFGNAGQNRVFINNGNAEFVDETAIRLPYDTTITQDIALIDVDKDGEIDIILGNEDGNQLWINQGNGVFKNETQHRFPSSTNIETRKVIVFDANHDGYDDVFLCNIASDTSKIQHDKLYLNNGKGVFKDVSSTHLPQQNYNTLDAVAMDLNADGKMDLILAHMGKVAPSVLINYGHFETDEQLLSTIPFPGNYIAIHAADFNNDGLTDLYFGGFMTDDRIILQSTQQPSIQTPNKNG